MTVLAVVAAGAMLLAACAGGGSSNSDGGGNDGEPVKGGNINVRIPQDPGSLDSVASSNAGTTYVTHHIFEQLATMNADFEPTPVLAESWDVSEDSKTYTFHLRTDVEFSDGTPMTSKDVLASLKDFVANGSYADALNRVLDSITAPDDKTVVLKLTEPMDVVALIAYSTGSQIHKADLVENKGPKGIPNDKVIGTGPYMLKGWTPGEEIVLERNDKYNPPKGEPSGYAGAAGQYLDTITFKVIGDDDASFNALKAGQIDVAALTSSQYELAKGGDTIDIGIQASGSMIHMAFNHHPESIMSNPDARNAINLVLDKQAVIAAQGAPELNKASNGAFAAQESKIMYSDAGKAKWEKHDPEKAKELLKKAGLKEGQVLKLLTTGEFPMFQDSLVQLQQDLKEIGVESEIYAYDFGTMISTCQDPTKWDILGLMDDSFPPIPNYTDNVVDLSCGGYDREALTPYITDYNTAKNAEEKKAAVDAIQKYTSEHLPTITLYDKRTAIGYTPKLKGYDGWALFFTNAWLSK